MNDVTFGIAILLATGLLLAKCAQLLQLPSVTGFIVTGVILGPSGLELLSPEAVGSRLDHFNQIALMLIAFGIGEHIELKRLGSVARDVGYISIFQAAGSFLVVTAGAYLTILWMGDQDDGGRWIISLLLGAISIATAPAAVLHVVREQDARGPLTSTLLAVVAVSNGVAILAFGMVVSVAHQLLHHGSVSPVTAVFSSFTEVAGSLAIGIFTGFLIDFSLNKLHSRDEMLTGGLALLLLCGETTRLLQLSPLLAGMAAGFTIINRAERDVRLFRIINSFEPPIYVLFFALAGVHMDLGALRLAGWIGLSYFLCRILGKYLGAWTGALFSKAEDTVRNFLGLALIPQAGVAIGLILIITADPTLSPWSEIITPVVLAGVVLSELKGPLFVRYTLKKADEVAKAVIRPECGGRTGKACDTWLRSPEGISIPPWNGEKLRPSAQATGYVVFGAYHFATVRGLARIGAILAHHYHATPLSVRVFSPADRQRLSSENTANYFMPENDEVLSLGSQLKTEIRYDTPAAGIISAVEENSARALVLGYPVGGNSLAFQQVLEKVSSSVHCPVIAVHLSGALNFDRILVPFLNLTELEELFPIIESVTTAVHPRISFLQLLHSDSSQEEIEAHEKQLELWLEPQFFDIRIRRKVSAVESRLETILLELQDNDLVLMAATKQYGLKRMFFGSLANSVVQNSSKPVLVVYTPDSR